jgi:hypothetical protein
MDWQTIAALALICAVAAFFSKDCLFHPPFVILIYPFLLVFSILAQYFLLQAELFTPKKLDQWLTYTLLASICGTLLARDYWPRLPFCATVPATTGRERGISMRMNPRRSWNAAVKAAVCVGFQSG